MVACGAGSGFSVEWFGMFTDVGADRIARPVHVMTVFAEGAVFEGEVPVKGKKTCFLPLPG